ncbi:shikimate kinase [Flavobacteriaceae bacterium 14752]|uniref:shikimate kinase n=1 Tax=Mesohalobacter salilacus TaxID=2491711 RepID=UPI000F637486|nr:shikimate kinase [Flavobacteriaceae bacterium 14752]
MIVLLGYMGCGKSSIGKHLKDYHNLSYCDLDLYIEKEEKQTISDIFDSKGEIYFRKIEHQYLKQVIKNQKIDILALGGGTPCYAENMDLLNSKTTVKSIYLKVNLEILTDRLFRQRLQRPLISNIETQKQLKDFIRKHLFEREYYYRQAEIIIDVSDLNIEKTANKILEL